MLTIRQQEIARRTAELRERRQRKAWTSFIAQWYPGLAGVPLETSEGLLLNTDTPMLMPGFNAYTWMKQHLEFEMVSWGLDRIKPQYVVRTWEHIDRDILPELSTFLGAPSGFAYLDASDGFAVPAQYWDHLIFDVSHESYLLLPDMGFVLQFDPFNNLGDYELCVARCR